MADSGDGGDATLEDLREKSLKEIASETVGSGLSITLHPNTRRSFTHSMWTLTTLFKSIGTKGLSTSKPIALKLPKLKSEQYFELKDHESASTL